MPGAVGQGDEYPGSVADHMVVGDQIAVGAQDKTGTIMENLDALAEKVIYGGLRPTTEEINLIQRQIEKAFKSAYPKDGKKDLNGIKLR